jgi:hypothetical protein
VAASITFDFLSRGSDKLAGDFKKTGDNAAAAARGAKVLQDTIDRLGTKENRTAAESANLAKALRLTGDAEDRAAAKALAADIAIRRLADAEQDAAKNAGRASGSFAGLAGEITGFGAASTAASSKSSLFAKGLAAINLASGVLEPALAGVVVAAGGLASGLAAAGAGIGVFGAVAKTVVAEASKAATAYAAAQAKMSAATTGAQRAAALKAEKAAFAGLSPPVKALAIELGNTQKMWKAFTDAAAPGVVGVLSQGIGILTSHFGVLGKFLPPVEAALSGLMTRLNTGLNSSGFKSFTDLLAKNTGPAITKIGIAVGNVVVGIGGILKAFMPVSQQMLTGVDKITAKFREWGTTLSAGTGFQSLMSTFKEETPQAVAILKNLGLVLANVGKAVFGLSSFSNSKMLLNMLLPLSGAMASLSKNTDLVRVAMYALMAVKIGQQFSWVTDAWKGLVKFAAAAEGATVAETIAAAATRAWGLAMDALPWVALAAAVVAVAVLIIKYHSQIWAFVQKVWHDVLAVIMATWDWVKTHWPLLVAIITGPIGLAVLFIIKHWTTMTTGIAALFDIAKNKIGIAWDQIELAALRGVKFILDKMGLLPFGMGEPFRKAARSIGNSMAGIQADVARRTGQIQADFDRLHGKTIKINVTGAGRWSVSGPTSATGVAHGPQNIGAGAAAAGLFINRGTGPTADDVLIRASRGELIVPARLVASGAVDHLRGSIPGFAQGGVTGSYGPGKLSGLGPWTVGRYGATELAIAQATADATLNAMRAAQKAAKAAAAAGSSVPGAGGGVTRWKSQILTALAMLGQSAGNLGAVEHRMMQESGGNPFAVNRTDSNWFAGTPSVGVMQVIGPTYRSNSPAGWRNLAPMAYGVSEDVLANTYAGLHHAIYDYRGRSLASVMMQSGGYAKGGLIPGYASGGVAGQGAAYLKAWQSRHGSGAHGPVVLNEQIARMTAAVRRAKALAGASGLSGGQHRFWAKAAASETRRLALLRRELATGRAWRTQLELSELGLDRQIRAAGNLPSLRGPVRGWKAQLGRDRAKVAAISKMLGYSSAYLAAHKPPPAPRKVTPPGVPGSIPHTGAYTDSTADLISQLFASLASNSRVVTLDSGGLLMPGLSTVYNGTGRPEQVIPAGRGGAGTVVLQNHGVIGSQAELENWLVRSMDSLKRKRRI